ncbi:Rrf2 family transcriptional regulator [Celeribacter sp.]|uniref:Rrf2 family transcriptional regulator n=1 Tax=Celeribacter sp. TaxID=1890673 RepID=UPI003A8F7569
MNKDTRLSGVLHVLIHLDHADKPLTSEALAKTMGTNPAVFRRTMSGLREAGYVRSEKGHGGGWVLERKLSEMTLLDVFKALDHKGVFSFGLRNDNPNCKVEGAVNDALSETMDAAQRILLEGLADVTLQKISDQAICRQARGA